MTVAGTLNLAAWLASALIAAWLLYDMTRVSRQHDESALVNLPETFEDLDTLDDIPGGTLDAGERERQAG